MRDQLVWGLVCAVIAFVFGTAAWVASASSPEAAFWLGLIAFINLVVAVRSWWKS
jgi:hypothetical protein